MQSMVDARNQRSECGVRPKRAIVLGAGSAGEPVEFRSGSEASYSRAVTEQAQAVLATALRLTVQERAELAAELLASLDGEPDGDVEAAWAADLERRVRRLEEEGSRGRPWQEVFDGYRRQP